MTTDMRFADKTVADMVLMYLTLEAELEEAKKDARRYRWLLRDGNIYLWFDSTGGVSLDILDAVIDTAMRGEGE